jgi:Glu-tRNA(Gln) amidotransferase subunit E-like FAD-binding protein
MENFNELWNKYIKPLEGKIVYPLARKGKNVIEKVTDDSLTRISSKGNESSIKKEDFEKAYKELKKKGRITRKEIFELLNKKRESSIVAAVLEKIPHIQLLENKVITLVYKG